MFVEFEYSKHGNGDIIGIAHIDFSKKITNIFRLSE